MNRSSNRTKLVSMHERHPSRFDRWAEDATDFASRGAFFAGCVLVVILWALSYFAFRNFDTWQLIINTATTIVTFLLVALLQNSERRHTRAIHHKLDALADGLADLMEHQLDRDKTDLERDIHELKQAVGLEQLPRRGARRARSRAADRGSTRRR